MRRILLVESEQFPARVPRARPLEILAVSQALHITGSIGPSPEEIVRPSDRGLVPYRRKNDATAVWRPHWIHVIDPVDCQTRRRVTGDVGDPHAALSPIPCSDIESKLAPVGCEGETSPISGRWTQRRMGSETIHP